MAKVQIICPSCSKQGYIEIMEETIKNVTRGLLAVNIASHTICEHIFIAYIDKNLNVRDYFIADFQVEIPEIVPKKKFEEFKVPGKDIVDIDLIKLNMPAILLAYTIKSIFAKQKVILITDYKFLYNHIINFFNYIVKDTFSLNIKLMSEEEYKGSKKDFKDYMVFQGTKIINNNDKLINPKKLYIEKQFASKFFSEQELGYSYILLKNEIQKVFELTKSIGEFIKKEETDGEKTNILKITSFLEKDYNTKINPTYLNFLIEIVENYFNIKVPSISESFLESL